MLFGPTSDYLFFRVDALVFLLAYNPTVCYFFDICGVVFDASADIPFAPGRFGLLPDATVRLRAGHRGFHGCQDC